MSEVIDRPKTEVKTEKRALKKWKITFHSGEGDKPDNSDVEIAHNYKLNVYKRNVETTIDENYLSVLRDAVIHTTIKNDETGVVTAVTIPRFSYTLGEQVA